MGQLSDRDDRSIDPTPINLRRKAYIAPHLLEYGSVAKLTQTGNGTKTDKNDNMAKPARTSPGEAPAKMR